MSIRLDEEPRSLERRNTGGSVKDKQLLIDKSTGLRPLQVTLYMMYSISIVVCINRILSNFLEKYFAK